MAKNWTAAPISSALQREAAALGGDVDQEGQREDGEDVIGDVLADRAGRRRAGSPSAARGTRRAPAASAAPRPRRALPRTAGSPPPGCGCTSRPATSTTESRNGTRQPQARKSASFCTPAISASTPAASRLPAATPACGQLAQKPRRAASPCSAAISTAPPHSPPTAKPWTRRSRISSERRPDADLGIGRQQADQHRRHAHQDQAQHQQPLAADPVAEMAEDDAADRPRDEAERIGGEGEQGAGQRIVGGEEQPVEDQGGGRAVEEEIVPFDGRADRGSPSPPAAAASPVPGLSLPKPCCLVRSAQAPQARRPATRAGSRRGGW